MPQSVGAAECSLVARQGQLSIYVSKSHAASSVVTETTCRRDNLSLSQVTQSIRSYAESMFASYRTVPSFVL